MARQQKVSDETGQLMLQEIFSLMCHIQFRQASNSNIQETVELLHDIKEKFQIGTYHPEFEYMQQQAQQQLQQEAQQQTQQQMQ